MFHLYIERHQQLSHAAAGAEQKLHHAQQGLMGHIHKDKPSKHEDNAEKAAQQRYFLFF